MEISWTVEETMETGFGYGYLEMYMMKKNTLVSYRGKDGKTI
jgi:hypothetical protein